MICKEILEYIEQVESGPYRVCKEQKALVRMVRNAFDTEDIYTNEEQLHNYLKLQKYFPFELFPWQKFVLALWDCTYWRESGLPRWDAVFCMISRGAGKDGFIAYDAACSVSPYNPVGRYDVDICANNEEQAMRPVLDFVEVLEAPKWETKLKKHYYHTKEKIQGRKNRGIIRGHTNNPKGRDGLRSGKVILNEVHVYEGYENIQVFTTGLGKVAEPRMGLFTSNGNVSDGVLDDYLQTAEGILFEGETDNGMLPFICRLNELQQVHDPENWYMANPSLQYLPNLMHETKKEYQGWKENPERHGQFLSKRMGIRGGVASDIAVTSYEKIKATNKPLPDLTGWSCTVGIDYAELSDWMAVNLHFRKGDERFDINHAWVCTHGRDLHRVKAPWREWAEAGNVTPVDEVTIDPDLAAEYIRKAGQKYNIKGIALDNFRYTLVKTSLQKIGFDAENRKNIKLVRPQDIMKVEPVISNCFDRELFTWGDVPHLRWATNNTKRVRSSRKIGSDTGNFYYAKIEAKSRKTDPFMALVASMTIEEKLGSGIVPVLPELPVFTF